MFYPFYKSNDPFQSLILMIRCFYSFPYIRNGMGDMGPFPEKKRSV